MSGQVKNKLKTLCLMQFFQKYTDAEHGATIDEMISYLESNDICAQRKSLYSDIELLRGFGMDIEAVRTKRTEYRLMSREFQLPELKLLVDSVGASKFITHKKSLELIDKLEAMTSIYEARELRRSVYVDKRVKTMNESIYYSVDTIHSAINHGNKLGFKYFTYTPDKKRTLKKSGNEYIVTPLTLTYADENYYLYAYTEEYGEIRIYRVDRMTGACEKKESADKNEITTGFNPAANSNEMFSMFGGEKRNVTLRFDNSLSTVVIDRFGTDVIFVPYDEKSFSVSVEVIVSPTFFGWLFGFGDKVKIVSPKEISDNYLLMLNNAISSYD
ncbi:MAG: WYL domain-containing protein [Oscillospiraceae bacterium]